jgi:hypothetical protein
MTITPSDSSAVIRPPLIRGDASMRRQYVPHTVHLKEFTMADGRRILIDKRAIAFVCRLCRERPDRARHHCRSLCRRAPISAANGMRHRAYAALRRQEEEGGAHRADDRRLQIRHQRCAACGHLCRPD